MKSYRSTIAACFVGYIVQAVINNFAPLLFLTFQSQYQLPISQITLLVSFNFLTQLAVDFAAIFFVDRIGYRISIVVAHFFAAIGLIGLAVFPLWFPTPFSGLLAAVLLYAIGGGLLEVLVSPIVEACPTEHKEKTMSMLHSFYCWGYVGVVLFSTAFFMVFGIQQWPILAIIWALIPLVNLFFFTKVPLAPIVAEGERGLTTRQLFSLKSFWLFLVMMVCAGASEQAVSQWASTFAEQGLGVSKTLGDLAGPMVFALMMGISRLLYGKFGERIDLKRFMFLSVLLCLLAYMMIGFASLPLIGFLGCGLSGFAVGIMWPGVFSLSAQYIRNGGTALFAYLALAGDLGCSIGPAVVGSIVEWTGQQLQVGILGAIVFPIILLAGIYLVQQMHKKRQLPLLVFQESTKE